MNRTDADRATARVGPGWCGSPLGGAIVVVTRDRADDLRRTLRHLGRIRSADRAIVVDNGSTDGTADVVNAEFPAVEVVRAGRNLAAAGRNLGVALAARDVVAFADDDSWWADDAIDRATALFAAHPSVGLLAGRILLGPEDREEPLNHELAASPLATQPWGPGPEILGFAACSAIVRRRAFLEAGGFEPLLGIGGEETLLALRLRDRGWRSVYAPELVAHHWPSSTRDPSLRRRRIVRNQLWTEWLARPRAEVVRRTASVAYRYRNDRGARLGVVDALRGAPRALVRRRPVGPAVAQLWATVDEDRHPDPDRHPSEDRDPPGTDQRRS